MIKGIVSRTFHYFCKLKSILGSDWPYASSLYNIFYSCIPSFIMALWLPVVRLLHIWKTSIHFRCAPGPLKPFDCIIQKLRRTSVKGPLSQLCLLPIACKNIQIWKSGVPHGVLRGPLFFMVCITDMVNSC